MSYETITMVYELQDFDTKEILESNLNTTPISFITGKEQILPKLEDAIKNLEVGSESSIVLEAQDGFGEYSQDGVQTIAKEQFVGIDLQIGMELLGEGDNGETTRVIVKEIGDDNVIVDFNHPYAGKKLNFIITLLEKRPSTEDEILSGVVDGQGCGCGHDHHDHTDDGCCGGEHHKHGGCCGKHHH